MTDIVEMLKFADRILTPAMDEAGKELAAKGCDPGEALTAIATQMLMMARFLLKLHGGSKYEAMVLYQHANDASAEVTKS